MRLMMTMVVIRSMMMMGMLMKIMIIALMPASFIPKYVMPTYMWWGLHPSGNIKHNVFVLLYGTRGTCVVSWFVVMYNKLIPWPTVAIMPKHTPGSSCANKAIINGSCGVFLPYFFTELMGNIFVRYLSTKVLEVFTLLARLQNEYMRVAK